MFTDIFTATIGGIDIAPSSDIGDAYAMFQPSHGINPTIAGIYLTNPIAMIMSSSMMMDWLAD
jgi:3-isopropylmalate dehydrogenase